MHRPLSPQRRISSSASLSMELTWPWAGKGNITTCSGAGAVDGRDS